MQAERPTTPAERFQEVAREMDFAGSERESFQQFFQKVRRETLQMREGNRPIMQRIWRELDKEHPDQATINQLIDQATENRRAYQKDMATALAGFLSTLTPAQRSRFVELLEKRQQDQNAAHIRRLITP
jgi:Spy/CpxP family protein refolding chaperone